MSTPIPPKPEPRVGSPGLEPSPETRRSAGLFGRRKRRLQPKRSLLTRVFKR